MSYGGVHLDGVQIKHQEQSHSINKPYDFKSIKSSINQSLCRQATTMNSRQFGSVISFLTMVITADIFVELLPISKAQPWFNVHVIQEYLNLTGKIKISNVKYL